MAEHGEGFVRALDRERAAEAVQGVVGQASLEEARNVVAAEEVASGILPDSLNLVDASCVVDAVNADSVVALHDVGIRHEEVFGHRERAAIAPDVLPH